MVDEATESVEWNTVYSSLADDERRELLRTLTKANGQKGVAEITEELLPEGADEERFEQLSARLHHVHLPKLAEAGLVDWDGNAQSVELTAFSYQLPVVFLTPTVITPTEYPKADGSAMGQATD